MTKAFIIETTDGLYVEDLTDYDIVSLTSKKALAKIFYREDKEYNTIIKILHGKTCKILINVNDGYSDYEQFDLFP